MVKMARHRSWSTHLDDKMLMNEIDKMLAEGMKWHDTKDEVGIGTILGTSAPNAHQYYHRRLEKFNVQQAVRDFDNRLRWVEEQVARRNIWNGQATSPPPPPPKSKKRVGTQLAESSSSILEELKNLNDTFAKIKAESINW